MRKTLITGVSAMALLTGMSVAALADSNEATAKNDLWQGVSNEATTVERDHDTGGIASEAYGSLNNNFGDNTFEHQKINQNNINSGINSAQQGGNAVAVSLNSDGGIELTDSNLSKAKNEAGQRVYNDAVVDAGENEDGDGIASEVDDTLNNNFGDNTFEHQKINQNNINSGINSAQQGGNAAAIALGEDDTVLSFNISHAENDLWQKADNDAEHKDENRHDGNDGIAGDANDALNNHFGSDTFDGQKVNQNNINSGINSAQQGGNALAASVADNAGGFELNLAVAETEADQEVDNLSRSEAEGDGDADGGVGGNPDHAFENEFGSRTFQDQKINQNNINAGINSGQQGANTVAAAVDLDGTVFGIGSNANIALSSAHLSQDVSNRAEAKGEDDAGIGGFEETRGRLDSMYNDFGSETFQNQAINQNNINTGINSAQQGANTVAVALDLQPGGLLPTLNLADAHTNASQKVRNEAVDESEGDDGEEGLGAGGNPSEDVFTNSFGTYTFQNQKLNQNNINAGINNAQQGATTVAVAVGVDLPFASDNLDLNNATATTGHWYAPMTQEVENKAKADGEGSGGVAGNPKKALNNNFGDYTFENQAINQNNINTGINSAQQGATTVAVAVGVDWGGFDENDAVSVNHLSQTVTNVALATGEDNDGGIGNSPCCSLNNNFGSHTFANQIVNQNNINSGINSAQQGAVTFSAAVGTNLGGLN